MKINEKTRIIGEKVVLVPYRKNHVLRYHEWMKSSELQELTASEPLSLEEEYQMQKRWREDEDKCTFIILDKETYDKNSNEIDSMIGDTNLFFNNSEDKHEAEAEIMIADSSQRGKGFGWEAVILMLRYGIEKLKVNKYQVKISITNEKSIKLFTKLGFNEVARSEVFNELTLAREVDGEFQKYLILQTPTFIMDENYE